MKRALRLLLWLLAILLFAWVFRSASLAEAWILLRQLDPLDLLLLALANGLVLWTLSGRWWLILRALGYPIGYLRLAAYRLAPFGVTYFTPGPQFGGEPLQVYLPEKYEGVPRSASLAAVALDKLLELLVNFAFLVVGLALISQMGLLPELAAGRALAAALALAALPLAFLAMIWAGWQPFSWPLAWIRRRLVKDDEDCQSFRGLILLNRVIAGIQASEAQARDFCREHPLALFLALVISLLSWTAMVAEYWLALHLLGLEMTLAQAIIAMTAARIAYLAALPAGLGALEASQVLAMQALGANPAAGLSISALMRGRDILLGGAGLWLAVRLLRRGGQAAAVNPSAPAIGLPSLATYVTMARKGRNRSEI